MKVSELIEFLKTQPQHLQVVYECYSEHNTLQAEFIEVEELAPARADGWVHDQRPGLQNCKYLVFPGN